MSKKNIFLSGHVRLRPGKNFGPIYPRVRASKGGTGPVSLAEYFFTYLLTYLGTYLLTYLSAQELEFIFFAPLSARDNQQKM